MKKINNQTYLTIGEVARLVNRSNQTIKNWYKWVEQEGLTLEEAGLPEYRRDLDGKGTYYFLKESVSALEKFRDSISYGQMSEFNVTRWGERGKAIEARKVELESAAVVADK